MRSIYPARTWEITVGYTRVGDFLAGLMGLPLLRSRVTDLGGKPFCDARIADLRSGQHLRSRAQPAD